MKYCPHCGKELVEGAVVCLNCGRSVNEINTNSNPVSPSSYTTRANSNVPDAPNTGMAVLGFFIPIVGLVLYLLWKDTTPLKAKSAGKGALIGFIVMVVSWIIIAIVAAAGASAALSSGYYY